MKRFLRFIALCVTLSIAANVSSNAQNSERPSTSPSKLKRVTPTKKHRAPSNTFIEYIYTGSGFSFLPAETFESLSVTVTGVNSSDTWSATISDTEGYVIETGPLSPGTYSISATTETGVEFYGNFVLTD